MPNERSLASELALSSGRILRCALLAALLAGALAAVLPPRWESRVALLPPEREAANFRYGETGGLRGLLTRVRPGEAMDPLDTWIAVLDSPATARELVRRFDLIGRWGSRSEGEAVERVRKCLSFVEVPYGPVEVRVATSDRQLSADLANAAVEVMRDRLIELYREDAEWERTFLAEAARSAAAAAGAEATLAATGARAGVVNDSLQTRAAARAARDRAVLLARARTARARAVLLHGSGSPEALDAESRIRELERRSLAAGPVRAAGTGAARREAGTASRDAVSLARQWLSTIEEQAGHEFELRVLDPAVPADRPARPVALPIALALLIVPGGAVGAALLRREVRALPVRMPAGSSVRRLARGRGGTILAAAAAAGAAALLAREPLAGAGALGLVFVAVVATSLRAAWLVLFAALPWAWDYIDLSRGFAVQIPTEPGMILLVAAWVYAWALRPRRFAWTPLVAAFLLVPVWTAVSALTSVNPRDSLFQVVAVTGFVLAGAAFPMVEMRSLERIRTAIRILLVSAAAAAMIGIVQVASSPGQFSRAAFYIGEGFLYNHGPYAAFLGFAMGPAFVFLLTERMSWRSLPILGAALLVTAATVISLARAGWLSMLALLAALAVVRGRQFLRKLAIPIALVTAVLVVGFLKSPFAAQAFAGYVERSTDESYGSNVDRLQRYVAALRMFRDRPLLGVGPGAYESAYDDYRSVDFETGVRGAHSEILRAASEQGVPGVLILAFLVASFYATGLKLMRGAPDPRVRRLAAALCAGMLTYTVHGLVNEYWRVSKVAFLMWVFVGLLAALEQMSRSDAAAVPAGDRSP